MDWPPDCQCKLGVAEFPSPAAKTTGKESDSSEHRGGPIPSTSTFARVAASDADEGPEQGENGVVRFASWPSWNANSCISFSVV